MIDDAHAALAIVGWLFSVSSSREMSSKSWPMLPACADGGVMTYHGSPDRQRTAQRRRRFQVLISGGAVQVRIVDAVTVDERSWYICRFCIYNIVIRKELF